MRSVLKWKLSLGEKPTAPRQIAGSRYPASTKAGVKARGMERWEGEGGRGGPLRWRHVHLVGRGRAKGNNKSPERKQGCRKRGWQRQRGYRETGVPVEREERTWPRAKTNTGGAGQALHQKTTGQRAGRTNAPAGRKRKTKTVESGGKSKPRRDKRAIITEDKDSKTKRRRSPKEGQRAEKEWRACLWFFQRSEKKCNGRKKKRR